MFRSIKIFLTLLFLMAPATMLHAQSCTLTSNFNGTPIPAGDYVWFNSVVSVRGLGSQPVNVFFSGGTITFTANGAPQTVYVPGATMTFSPDTTQATTSFDANGWTTNLQSSGLAGNDFLTAVAVQVAADYNSLGVKPVDDNRGSQYQNSDHAGTPENYKQFVLGGARG